jgi:hypothetical protein
VTGEGGNSCEIGMKSAVDLNQPTKSASEQKRKTRCHTGGGSLAQDLNSVEGAGAAAGAGEAEAEESSLRFFLSGTEGKWGALRFATEGSGGARRTGVFGFVSDSYKSDEEATLDSRSSMATWWVRGS